MKCCIHGIAGGVIVASLSALLALAICHFGEMTESTPGMYSRAEKLALSSPAAAKDLRGALDDGKMTRAEYGSIRERFDEATQDRIRMKYSTEGK